MAEARIVGHELVEHESGELLAGEALLHLPHREDDGVAPVGDHAHAPGLGLVEEVGCHDLEHQPITAARSSGAEAEGAGGAAGSAPALAPAGSRVSSRVSEARATISARRMSRRPPPRPGRRGRRRG